MKVRFPLAVVWRRGAARVKFQWDSADAMHSMRALSIRQPYAELILRGIKTIE